MKQFVCQYCAKETSNAGGNKKHENSCQKNPNPIKYERSILAGAQKGNKAWNKGLNKEIDARVSHKESTKIKIGKASTGRNHTQTTKKKISESMKKYFDENPHMSPWVYSHYSKKRSYPERYWFKIFKKYGLIFSQEYQFYRFRLDFAFTDKLIDVEIDGKQHYNENNELNEKDKIRDSFLKEKNWNTIRINWKEYKKLDRSQRKEYVRNIVALLK